MSLVSPKLERRERAIEAARRQIRRLEIETHRVKASLARLEADYEDDVADTLTRRLRRRARAERELDAADEDWQERFDDAVEFESSSPTIDGGGTQSSVAVLPFAAPPTERRRRASPPKGRRVSEPIARERTEPPPAIVAEPSATGTAGAAPLRVPRTAPYRKTAGPLAVSFGVHAVALIFCVSFTFVTLVQQRIPLFASPTESDDDLPAACQRENRAFKVRG